MKLKSRLIAFAGALVMAGSSFAAFEGPTACPSVGAIKAEGLVMAEIMMNGIYLTYNLSPYDTTENWLFVIGPVMSDSDDEALDEGNKMLDKLSGTPIPQNIEDESWACIYNIGYENTFAVAFQSDSMLSLSKVKHYLNKKH